MTVLRPVIVINALSARQGGGQTYIKNVLSFLPRNLDLTVYVYAPLSLALPDDPRVLRKSTRWPTENPLLRTFWEKLCLTRALKNLKADVLFCPGGIITCKAPPNCSTVTMFRNMLPFDAQTIKRLPFGLQRLRNMILRRVMLRSMETADLTIFISNYARRVIEELIPVRKALTIPHGVSSAFRTHSRKMSRPEWLPAGEYILYVSKFDVYKHQLEVAEAYASLPAHLRERYSLVFIGEADNDLAKDVKTLAQRCGLAERVVVAGAIPYSDLPGAYRFAAINVFASSCENCPNILLEAFGAGQPVLTSDVMPMPEFAGDAAAYFKPHSATSIAQAMTSVLDDDDLKSTLASRAQGRSADFDWERTASQTWHEILKLAAT